MTTSERQHTVFLCRRMGFPNGMAATQRVRLLAKALKECGQDVSVLCISVSEHPPNVQNRLPKGVHEGVPFEYTTGATVRASSFLKRRAHEIRGLLRAMRMVAELKVKGRLSVIYLWITVREFAFESWLFCRMARMLHIPTIIEVNEAPWSFKPQKSVLERLCSPLFSSNGAIAISPFLYAWALAEYRRLGQPAKVIELPVLVDAQEFANVTPNFSETPNFLFAGAPEYGSTIRFIMDAMVRVWQKHRDVKLTITGCRGDSPAASEIRACAEAGGYNDNVIIAGYLPREELLRRYREAWGLLIPLFGDTASMARFPTKIAEYACSGAPIVTSNVGAVKAYFQDMFNAYIAEPDDAESFAGRIIDIVDNPENARRVGEEGARTAMTHFHYSMHANRLLDFIRDL